MISGIASIKRFKVHSEVTINDARTASFLSFTMESTAPLENLYQNLVHIQFQIRQALDIRGGGVLGRLTSVSQISRIIGKKVTVYLDNGNCQI